MVVAVEVVVVVVVVVAVAVVVEVVVAAVVVVVEVEVAVVVVAGWRRLNRLVVAEVAAASVGRVRDVHRPPALERAAGRRTGTAGRAVVWVRQTTGAARARCRAFFVDSVSRSVYVPSAGRMSLITYWPSLSVTANGSLASRTPSSS